MKLVHRMQTIYVSEQSRVADRRDADDRPRAVFDATSPKRYTENGKDSFTECSSLKYSLSQQKELCGRKYFEFNLFVQANPKTAWTRPIEITFNIP